MQKVVIASFHPLLLKGIISSLEENEVDCEIVGRTHSAKGLLALIKRFNPDAAIIDISITWNCGMDILGEINKIDQAHTLEIHFICTHPIDKNVCEYLEKKSGKTTYQYIKKDHLNPAI